MCFNFCKMSKLDTHNISMTKHYQYVSPQKATLNGFKIIKVGKTQNKYEQKIGILKTPDFLMAFHSNALLSQ